jgi:hypothetical protein
MRVHQLHACVLASCLGPRLPRPPFTSINSIPLPFSPPHVTHHTSHVTRHTSHVTRHTSHVTRLTSHVTRHCRFSGNTLPPPSPPPLVNFNKFTGRHYRYNRQLQRNAHNKLHGAHVTAATTCFSGRSVIRLPIEPAVAARRLRRSACRSSRPSISSSSSSSRSA